MVSLMSYDATTVQ